MPSTSKLSVTQHSPQYWRVTFDNPPINLVDPEMIVALSEVLTTIEQDNRVAVVVFDSADPEFFMAHYDLTSDPFPLDALPAHHEYAAAPRPRRVEQLAERRALRETIEQHHRASRGTADADTATRHVHATGCSVRRQHRPASRLRPEAPDLHGACGYCVNDRATAVTVHLPPTPHRLSSRTTNPSRWTASSP